MAAYYADDSEERGAELTYSQELGLAIELPPEGLSVKSLWSVV